MTEASSLFVPSVARNMPARLLVWSACILKLGDYRFQSNGNIVAADIQIDDQALIGKRILGWQGHRRVPRHRLQLGSQLWIVAFRLGDFITLPRYRCNQQTQRATLALVMRHFILGETVFY